MSKQDLAIRAGGTSRLGAGGMPPPPPPNRGRLKASLTLGCRFTRTDFFLGLAKNAAWTFARRGGNSLS